ncbi:MAG: hypothetical protein PHN88_16145 [Ignavibacteria bacterium]|nr:hypothetical protein [Ignavibacteria bacterium]
MQSYCFEIKSACKKCGNPISINAFENEIFCESCGNKNEISPGHWKSIVSDNIKEAKDFSEGEGQNSKTFAGDFEFSLLFGKQMARCGNCKTTIPEVAYEKLSGSSYKCAKCGAEISVRKPDEFVLKLVPQALYLAGEDANQFNTGGAGIKKPGTVKPVLFTCPSCAGNLEVDGTARMITCKFCNSKIYLPDELWHELHPVKTVSRWYILIDEAKIDENTLPDWYYLSDITTDKDGNIYAATADDDRIKFLLWSISPDLKVRWIRNDIEYDHDNTGITTTLNGKLLLWNINKRSLNVYSCKDGSGLPFIKGEDAAEQNPYPFNLKGCTSLISDTDNTLLAIVNNTFVRFYDDGSRAPVWKVVSQKGEKPGFFSRLFGGGETEIKIPEEEYYEPPRLKEIGSRPKHIDGEFTSMNLGHDGFLYILDKSADGAVLAKYSREGTQIWKEKVPIDDKDGKPCADRNGNVYVIGKDSKYKVNLIRFSDDGSRTDLVQNDILDGGLLSCEDNIAAGPDGTIYAFRFYNVLKVFAPDMSCKYASEGSKKADKERLEDYKKDKERES